MIYKNNEEKGVSPVIGVILMVALTVVLAAVVGNYVFGFTELLGEGNNPSAGVQIDQERLNTGEWEVSVTLVKSQNADSIRIRKQGTGSIPEIEDEGVTKSVTVDKGETVSIVAIKGTEQTVVTTHKAGEG